MAEALDALTKGQRGQSLVVLDHAEAAWDKDPLRFEQLLQRLGETEGLSLVVSLRGEERPVGPDWWDAIRIGPLPLPAARDAFLAIAGERFRRDPELDPLLEAVDRLPLAIELLARRAEGESDLGGLVRQWHEARAALCRRGEKPSKVEVSRRLSPPPREKTETEPAERAVGAAPAR